MADQANNARLSIETRASWVFIVLAACAVLTFVPQTRGVVAPTFARVFRVDVRAGGPGIREYAPGVVIDWGRRRVEVTAKVAMDRGPLELLACAPQSKEHESVLVIQADPLRMYEAMGLVGLVPGSPPRFDQAAVQWKAATGQPLQLLVRYSQGGVEYTLPAEWLLVDRTSGVVPTVLAWVFAGSTWFDGRFGAQVEGTVASLVNFETSLISTRSLHSSSDDELWVRANPQFVPARGTTCTLVIDGWMMCHRVPFTLTTQGVLMQESGARPGGDESALDRLVDTSRTVSTPEGPRFARVTLDSDVTTDAVVAWRQRVVEAGADLRGIELLPRARQVDAKDDGEE